MRDGRCEMGVRGEGVDEKRKGARGKARKLESKARLEGKYLTFILSLPLSWRLAPWSRSC